MSIFKCPGSDFIRDPQPESVKCSSCGKEVDIWSDEEEVACPSCGGMVFREIPPSCLEWCAHARECIGPERYDHLKKGREERQLIKKGKNS